MSITTLFEEPRELRALRPHQTRGMETLKHSLRAGKRRPLLQMPTGAGKTLLAAHIIKGALDKAKKVAFVVPALSLIDQTVAAFEREGIYCVGVMQGFHERTDFEAPVQVCSVQTLARRKKPEVDLVIVDEAHVLHKSLLSWISKLMVPVIGLSATPWTRGLGQHYDDLIIATTTAELIEHGFLAPFRAFAPSEPDLSKVGTSAGDFKQDELADVMDQPGITGDIIQTWLEKGEDRQTFAFCVNREHARHVCERFVEADVAAEYMDGMTPREDREETFRRFTSGDTRIICNVGVLTTGIDLDVRCIIDAKPTQSRMLFVQTLGRGLRTAPGKENCLILDHAGNHLRLGMVTDATQDVLDDGEARIGASEPRERAEPLPRLCKACKAVMPVAAKVCPCCGETAHALTSIVPKDGDLVELGGLAKWRAQKNGLTEEERRTFFLELKGLKKPEWKDGWAAAQYKERFGEWPPRRWSAYVALEPSLATRSWLKAKQIAFAKARERG